MANLDTLKDLKDYLNYYNSKSLIDKKDLNAIYYDFLIRGGKVHEILDTIDSYGDINDLQFLINTLIGKIGLSNALFLQEIIHKLYLVFCKVQIKEGKPLHKGLILYIEGSFYFLSNQKEIAIRYITLALIDDIIFHDVDWAMKSNAYRFLATHIYDETTANKIITELKLRIDIVKAKSKKNEIYYPEDVLNVDDHIDVIPGEANNLFKLNLTQYNEIFNKFIVIKNDKKVDKNIKGKILEEIVKNLFSSVIGLQFISERIRTKSSELDLVYRILESDNVFYEMFGQYLVLECKNWEKPVSAPAVRDFKSKLEASHVKGGIIVTTEGLTGKNKNRIADAEYEIITAYHGQQITIVIMEINDLEKILNGENLIKLIVKNYEKIRFSKN